MANGLTIEYRRESDHYMAFDENTGYLAYGDTVEAAIELLALMYKAGITRLARHTELVEVD